MKVDVSSSSPVLWMEVDTDDFGKLFARMNDEQQVEVLRSMVRHMSPHAMQWDYIQIALEKPENAGLRNSLADIFSENHHA